MIVDPFPLVLEVPLPAWQGDYLTGSPCFPHHVRQHCSNPNFWRFSAVPLDRICFVSHTMSLIVLRRLWCLGKGRKDVNDTLDSSLNRPDDPWWGSEIGYNPVVASFLEQAYDCLSQVAALDDGYGHVYANARACQGRSMSHRQRMLVRYLMGVALVGRDGDYNRAFDHFAEAIHIAEDINDTGSTIELAYLAGSAARAMNLCNDAVECYAYGLNVLRGMPRPSFVESAAPSREVDLLLGLALNNFALGQYAQMQHHLEESRLLLNGIPSHGLQEAAIESYTALLLRWQGRPELALNAALRASNAYANLATSPAAKLAFDRQSAVVAEIALDLAESRHADGYESERAEYVAIARPHVKKAVRLAREVQDLPGWGLAELSRVRYERVARQADTGRVAAIEGVIKTGRRLQDVALIAQAQTALGHELTAQGKDEQGRTRYRKALDSLEYSEVPAMGRWARSALLMYKEMTRR